MDIQHLKNDNKASFVQSMFARIAPHYDLMNRLMTFGQDIRWRKAVIQKANLPGWGRILDLGTGTGDLAIESLIQYPGCDVVAADFTIEMMRVGRENLRHTLRNTPGLSWSAADAQLLPFVDETFDAVVSGFLMRNLVEVSASLHEQYRVLKPRGKVVILDTTPPANSIFSPVIQLHMHTVIPILGMLIAGNPDAYNYLPDSTVQFLEPERLAARMMDAGFRAVSYQRFMFGTIAIHTGVK